MNGLYCVIRVLLERYMSSMLTVQLQYSSGEMIEGRGLVHCLHGQIPDLDSHITLYIYKLYYRLKAHSGDITVHTTFITCIIIKHNCCFLKEVSWVSIANQG